MADTATTFAGIHNQNEVAKCRRETVERIIAVAMDAPLGVTELR